MNVCEVTARIFSVRVHVDVNVNVNVTCNLMTAQNAMDQGRSEDVGAIEHRRGSAKGVGEVKDLP